MMAQPRTTPALCVGVLSGTSVDGIDVALVELQGKPPDLTMKVLHFATVPFAPDVRAGIFELFDVERATVAKLSQMNFLLGELFAQAVIQVVAQAGVALADILLISSHGQTIFHNPNACSLYGHQVRSTLQIGEASVIAEMTGRPVVADFRVRDMAAGGQGAPVVPYLDRILFSAEFGQGPVVAANIGGIANLTLLPHESHPGDLIAFDTGPGNMIVDGLVSHMTRGQQSYDRDALISRRGRVQDAYLATWMRHPYLAQRPPKTTGRELFGQSCVDQWLQEGEQYGISGDDLVATATAFTVRSFADAVKRFVLPYHHVTHVYIGGGGAYNPAMMDGIAKELTGIEVVCKDAQGIRPDAKEAVAFAVLGYECYAQRANNVPSATGARHPVVMGKISW